MFPADSQDGVDNCFPRGGEGFLWRREIVVVNRGGKERPRVQKKEGGED